MEAGMRIVNGDVIYLRDGSPALVRNVNREAGEVVLDYDLRNVQKQAANGIKNGLDEQQRKAYESKLSEIKDDSKHEEIKNLYALIQFHKESKRVDPKVLHYLENELMHRMLRDNYVPENYQENLRNVPQY
jgi:hypothetical protein